MECREPPTQGLSSTDALSANKKLRIDNLRIALIRLSVLSTRRERNSTNGMMGASECDPSLREALSVFVVHQTGGLRSRVPAPLSISAKCFDGVDSRGAGCRDH
jgi:hypothetical protein